MARAKLRGMLLCEDKEHERFFRRLLKKWFAVGRLRVSRVPSSQGAGDAWVIQNYSKEVKYARSKRAENYALVVVIDGDQYPLQKRLEQLEKQLTDAGMEKRKEDELIVVCVPTRNIETWELWLSGSLDVDVDEDRDFKLKARQRDSRLASRAAEAWFRESTSGAKDHEFRTLPALVAGRREIDRLDRQESRGVDR